MRIKIYKNEEELFNDNEVNIYFDKKYKSAATNLKSLPNKCFQFKIN